MLKQIINITRNNFAAIAILIFILFLIFFYIQRSTPYISQEHLLPIESYNKNNTLPRTIIISHSTLNNNYINRIINNHKQYAKKHGYDYWFRNGSLSNKFINKQSPYFRYFSGVYWQKLIAVQDAMNIIDNAKPKYDWIMWIDDDAVFTNMNISLEHLKLSLKVAPKDYLIIAKDLCCSKDNICIKNNCINAGVMLFRNNNAAKQFIQNVIDSFPFYKNFKTPEQTAIIDQIFGFMKRDNNIIQVKKYIGKNKCNNPPAITGIKLVNPKIMNVSNSGCPTNWQAKDFIIHFAGKKDKSYEINKFLDCWDNNYNKDLSLCEYQNIDKQ